jgi:hypothetical protein
MGSDVAYRLRAAELVERAKSGTNSILVAEFKSMALVYLRLAQQAERNARADITYEPPPKVEDRKIKR